jgi:hypothetical protein
MNNAEQPAFPFIWNNESQVAASLTKREYVLIMCLQGIISNAPIGQLSASKQGVELAFQWSDEFFKQLESNDKV